MTEVEVVTKFSEQVRLFGLRRTIHARWVQWWGNRRRAAVADTVTGWCGEFFPHRLCQNTNIGCTCICHEEPTPTVDEAYRALEEWMGDVDYTGALSEPKALRDALVAADRSEEQQKNEWAHVALASALTRAADAERAVKCRCGQYRVQA